MISISNASRGDLDGLCEMAGCGIWNENPCELRAIRRRTNHANVRQLTNYLYETLINTLESPPCCLSEG